MVEPIPSSTQTQSQQLQKQEESPQHAQAQQEPYPQQKQQQQLSQSQRLAILLANRRRGPPLLPPLTIYCGNCFLPEPSVVAEPTAVAEPSTAASSSSSLSSSFMTTRFLRCSRCKVVQYCSQQCQQTHYRRIHKGPCRTLYELRQQQQVQQEVQQEVEKVGGSENDSSSPPISSSSSSFYSVPQLQRREANIVFQIAYWSSDTVTHGAYMYEQALDVYGDAMVKSMTTMQRTDSNEADNGHDHLDNVMWFDHLRLLLVALGYGPTLLATLSTMDPTENDESSVRPAIRLATLLHTLHGLTESERKRQQRPGENQKDDDAEASVATATTTTAVAQQLLDGHGQSLSPSSLWTTFFDRGAGSSFHHGTFQWPLPQPPTALSLPSSSASSHPTHPIPLLSPPKEFFMFLQDSCFMDPIMSAAIDEWVEPIVERLREQQQQEQEETQEEEEEEKAPEREELY